MKISVANSKTGIESFNIHNKICGSLDFVKKQGCTKTCYYNKLIRLYPIQNKFLNDNYEATLKSDFVKKMNDELKKTNIRYFRIHACGEFYSDEYYKKWLSIIKANPEIIFFTYTKNFNLKKYKRPKNFILYLSDNIKAFEKYYKYFDGISTMVDNKNQICAKDISKICTHQINGIKCIQCRRCIQKGGSIIFLKH